MTTFAEVAAMRGRTLMVLLDVSLDDFATVAYRWGTHAGIVNGQRYDKRILSIGAIKRGFGQDHLPASATVSLQLANVDFAIDWMVSHTTVETQVLRARFKLSVGLSDDTTNTYQSTIITQQLGIFVCLDYPRAKANQVQLSLADDSLGQLADVLLAPSLKDWVEDPSTTTVNSLFLDNDVQHIAPSVDPNIPTPLQFRSSFTAAVVGSPARDGTPVGLLDFDLANWPVTQRQFLWPILVCATRSTATITTDDVQAVVGVYRPDILRPEQARGQRINIPETFLLNGNTTRIWKSYKTQTITINGYDWKLLWIAFHAVNYDLWFGKQGASTIGLPQFSGTTPSLYDFNSSGDSDENATLMAAFDHFNIVGAPGSGIHDGAGGPLTAGRACDIMKDFVEYYSPMGSAGVDTARFTRADLVTPIVVRGSVSAIPAPTAKSAVTANASPYGVGVLRQAIADLAGTADFDVFLTMAGQVALVHQGADFETATAAFPTILESRIDNVEVRTPSLGERWSPYNRVYIPKDGGQIGPYDNAAAITAWGRILPKTIGAKWWHQINGSPPPTAPIGGNVNNIVWGWRALEAKVRPIISFTTDLGGLSLELGDYFLMAWTRGGVNALYPATLWRLESASINLSGQNAGQMQLEAVWMEDLRTEHGYLLDNETLLVRASTGGATLTVTDGSLIVTRSAGSFITAGVAVGDILRLRDTSEGLTGFTRNRDVRVHHVDSALQITLEASTNTDFGTAGAHVIAAADWAMLRGATTYPDAVSDAANYPSGGTMYGKISGLIGGFGEYSDGSEGNRLLDG